MPAINPGVYRDVLRVREAYAFDIGGLLMRFYTYMTTIGPISALTLTGYSFLSAGIVAAVVAVTTFLVAPRISKLVDEHGQSRVVPFAALITLGGLVAMLVVIALRGPVWALIIAAFFLGCIPSPQALVRARWTYLVRTGRLGDKAPDLRTIFSYEGVLDDMGFMFGPPICVALASAIAPIAGLLACGVLFVVGVALIMVSRSTEPTVGWDPDEQNQPEKTAAKAPRGKAAHTRSIILVSSVVRVLFAFVFLVGGFFGVFDTATVSLTEGVGNPGFASVVLALSGCASMVAGFLFGMLKLRAPQHVQLTTLAILIGCAFGTMVFVNSLPVLVVLYTAASVFYAPFLIVINATCEHAVSGNRLTEALTWINAGLTCGLAFGPIVAGVIVDNMGAFASFDFGAIVALVIPVTALLCYRTVKRHLCVDESRDALSDEPS